MTELAENPYSAPESNLEKPLHSGDMSVFPRFSTWAVFGLSIITFGIYAAYWLYSRTNKLNSITDNKISQGFITTALVLYAASILVQFAPFIIGFESVATLMSISPLISLAVFVVWIVWAFKFRNRLNEITNSAGKPTWAGPILTFFFQTFYLSYKVNQNIDVQKSLNS
ncbi:DUF4234 domain-containing protein [Neptuniibacter caesariensis]|uniref:DUF4234 domain-containing protein n=1 Tax=Neptuniibacter caesariensis TaxID=207954 RepID=A0A7U8GRC5_NEPCE|nr:DUF4234 domain-containing protein [Neptuniibacter caesariensis]EAR61227.1 hypothetical protein MED92_10889 [Oceanospirillum sp. MED92] [Neptuniibacter caesariensis]